MAESVAELRAWAAEIARNKDVYPTWKEDCRVLNQAAKEIERLREEGAGKVRCCRALSAYRGGLGFIPRHRMDRDGFFDSRLNMPRGHCGFAMCLIRKRNERPAPLVGDVEAPTFCHASYRSDFPHGSSSGVDHPCRGRRVRVLDLDPIRRPS